VRRTFVFTEEANMKKTKLLFVSFTLVVLACNAMTQPLFPTATPTAADITVDPNCPNPQPSQDYIDAALQHNQEYFSSPGWKNSYTVMESRVSVTWKNDDLSAVANVDHVIFCDATSARLDEYYTPDVLAIIFQNYESHEIQKDCRSGDTRLYELKVQSQGFDYNARFWVEIVDGDHTRETLLVFPVDDTIDLDLYSKKIMPELSICE
jgi:hypothetical protein